MAFTEDLCHPDKRYRLTGTQRLTEEKQQTSNMEQVRFEHFEHSAVFSVCLTHGLMGKTQSRQSSLIMSSDMNTPLIMLLYFSLLFHFLLILFVDLKLVSRFARCVFCVLPSTLSQPSKFTDVFPVSSDTNTYRKRIEVEMQINKLPPCTRVL